MKRRTPVVRWDVGLPLPLAPRGAPACGLDLPSTTPRPSSARYGDDQMQVTPTQANDERRVKIAVRNLYKVFGPQPERAIKMLEGGAGKRDVQERLGNAVGVHDVSLDILEGETFVLMGLSGSGKSTLLRLLNRLHEPTSGQILVDGVDIAKLSGRELLRVRREKFSGMVFQQFAILPHRNVVENVGYGLEVQGVPPAERVERAMRAIELVGLAGWESNYPAQLSGGMQ